MHELLNQIAKSTDTGEFYLALFTSLSLPDICGAMQSTDGKATRTKYIEWFDNYLSRQYLNLNGDICYSFRCAALHQGRTQQIGSSHPRIMFYSPIIHKNFMFHDNMMNGVINIDVRVFSYDIVKAVRKWLDDMKSNSNFQMHYPHFLQQRENGIYS